VRRRCASAGSRKRLLVYRASEPFRKMVVHLLKDGEPQPAEGEKPQRLIEVLGRGFQYVVAGLHPVTGKDYEWMGRPLHEWDREQELALITPEQVAEFFAAIQEAVRPLGYTVGRASSTKRADCIDQDSLKAPSFDALRTVVGLIPNTNDLFPGRDDMIQMAYAIKGAGQENQTAALELFLDWGMRWEGNHLFPSNDPEELEREWSKCTPPFRTGWPWLAKFARGQGWSDAAEDFSDVPLLPFPPNGSKSSVPTTETEWGDPQPLIVQLSSAPYPINALPPLIRAAVEEVAEFVKAPIPLVVTSALAAVSIAGQGHADVERATRLSGPTSLFLLAIADSGERKSTCDSFFTEAIRAFEQQQAVAVRPWLEQHSAELDAWNARREGLTGAIKSAARTGHATDDLEERLVALQETCPKAPRVPRMLLGDETPENLAWRLAKHWPSAGVVSSEAGLVFGSYGMGKDSVMRNLALLNVLWDGSSHSVGRRTSESFLLERARLTVALQVQGATLQEFFDRSGSLARGTGFLARFLISWPESTQGQRPFTEAPESWPHLEAFNARISELLLDPFAMSDEGAIDPVLFRLSFEAKQEWVEFHDTTEAALAPGRELDDVRDVASKAADNVARLAALFQVFMHDRGPVAVEYIRSGAQIVRWHLNESRRFLGQAKHSPEVADAIRLEKWILERCRTEQTHSLLKNHIRQYVSSELRSSARLDDALNVLHDANRIFWVRAGGSQTVHVNPRLLPHSDRTS